MSAQQPSQRPTAQSNPPSNPQSIQHSAERSGAQHVSISIDAPVEVVWSVFTDVQQWPTWTKSVSSVQLLDGPMRVGATVRIRQPKLPTVTWTVTEFDPGRSWTWQATSPGARTVASHDLTGSGSSTVATQSIVPSGPLGRVAGRLYRSLTARYLTLEAEGLKRRSEQVARAAAGAPPMDAPPAGAPANMGAGE